MPRLGPLHIWGIADLFDIGWFFTETLVDLIVSFVLNGFRLFVMRSASPVALVVGLLTSAATAAITLLLALFIAWAVLFPMGMAELRASPGTQGVLIDVTNWGRDALNLDNIGASLFIDVWDPVLLPLGQASVVVATRTALIGLNEFTHMQMLHCFLDDAMVFSAAMGPTVLHDFAAALEALRPLLKESVQGASGARRILEETTRAAEAGTCPDTRKLIAALFWSDWLSSQTTRALFGFFAPRVNTFATRAIRYTLMVMKPIVTAARIVGENLLNDGIREAYTFLTETLPLGRAAVYVGCTLTEESLTKGCNLARYIANVEKEVMPVLQSLACTSGLFLENTFPRAAALGPGGTCDSLLVSMRESVKFVTNVRKDIDLLFQNSTDSARGVSEAMTANCESLGQIGTFAEDILNEYCRLADFASAGNTYARATFPEAFRLTPQESCTAMKEAMLTTVTYTKDVHTALTATSLGLTKAKAAVLQVCDAFGEDHGIQDFVVAAVTDFCKLLDWVNDPNKMMAAVLKVVVCESDVVCMKAKFTTAGHDCGCLNAGDVPAAMRRMILSLAQRDTVMDMLTVDDWLDRLFPQATAGLTSAELARLPAALSDQGAGTHERCAAWQTVLGAPRFRCTVDGAQEAIRELETTTARLARFLAPAASTGRTLLSEEPSAAAWTSYLAGVCASGSPALLINSDVNPDRCCQPMSAEECPADKGLFPFGCACGRCPACPAGHVAKSSDEFPCQCLPECPPDLELEASYKKNTAGLYEVTCNCKQHDCTLTCGTTVATAPPSCGGCRDHGTKTCYGPVSTTCPCSNPPGNVCSHCRTWEWKHHTVHHVSVKYKHYYYKRGCCCDRPTGCTTAGSWTCSDPLTCKPTGWYNNAPGGECPLVPGCTDQAPVAASTSSLQARRLLAAENEGHTVATVLNATKVYTNYTVEWIDFADPWLGESDPRGPVVDYLTSPQSTEEWYYDEDGVRHEASELDHENATSPGPFRRLLQVDPADADAGAAPAAETLGRRLLGVVDNSLAEAFALCSDDGSARDDWFGHASVSYSPYNEDWFTYCKDKADEIDPVLAGLAAMDSVVLEVEWIESMDCTVLAVLENLPNPVETATAVLCDGPAVSAAFQDYGAAWNSTCQKGAKAVNRGVAIYDAIPAEILDGTWLDDVSCSALSGITAFPSSGDMCAIVSRADELVGGIFAELHSLDCSSLEGLNLCPPKPENLTLADITGLQSALEALSTTEEPLHDLFAFFIEQMGKVGVDVEKLVAAVPQESYDIFVAQKPAFTLLADDVGAAAAVGPGLDHLLDQLVTIWRTAASHLIEDADDPGSPPPLPPCLLNPPSSNVTHPDYYDPADYYVITYNQGSTECQLVAPKPAFQRILDGTLELAADTPHADGGFGSTTAGASRGARADNPTDGTSAYKAEVFFTSLGLHATSKALKYNEASQSYPLLDRIYGNLDRAAEVLPRFLNSTERLFHVAEKIGRWAAAHAHIPVLKEPNVCVVEDPIGNPWQCCDILTSPVQNCCSGPLCLEQRAVLDLQPITRLGWLGIDCSEYNNPVVELGWPFRAVLSVRMQRFLRGAPAWARHWYRYTGVELFLSFGEEHDFQIPEYSPICFVAHIWWWYLPLPVTLWIAILFTLFGAWGVRTVRRWRLMRMSIKMRSDGTTAKHAAAVAARLVTERVADEAAQAAVNAQLQAEIAALKQDDHDLPSHQTADGGVDTAEPTPAPATTDFTSFVPVYDVLFGKTDATDDEGAQ